MNAAIRRARAAIEGDRRSEERFNVTLKTALFEGGQIRSAIYIINMSMTGFLAESRERHFIGTPVSIHLPGIGERHAEARWSGNGMLGCGFAIPIPQCQFYDLLDIIGTEPSPKNEILFPTFEALDAHANRKFDA